MLSTPPPSSAFFATCYLFYLESFSPPSPLKAFIFMVIPLSFRTFITLFSLNQMSWILFPARNLTDAEALPTADAQGLGWWRLSSTHIWSSPKAHGDCIIINSLTLTSLSWNWSLLTFKWSSYDVCQCPSSKGAGKYSATIFLEKKGN